MKITCLGHKRDMRGKHHVYGSVEYKKVSGETTYLQFWGECSSAFIHFKDLGFWDTTYLPRKLEGKGYKPLLAEHLKRSFPKVIDMINQEIMVREIRGT